MASTITPCMAYLTMPRNQFSAYTNITFAKTFDKVTVGAAILQFIGPEPQILLLKRRADENHYPNVFEMPGGKVDATDATIRDAIVREVAEESDLAVTDVVHPLSIITYTTEKSTIDTGKENKPIKRHAIQLSYVVTVHGGTKFKVNKEEHSVGVWANREMLEDLNITKDMKELVSEALQWGENEGKTR